MNIYLEIIIRYIGIGIILAFIESVAVIIISNVKMVKKLKNDPWNYTKNMQKAACDVQEAKECFKHIGALELFKLFIWCVVFWPKALCTAGWFIYNQVKTN